MTNVFGGGAPTISSIDEADTGPLQLGHAFIVGVPCLITHIRYYVATVTMNTNSPTLPFYAWRQGEPDSTVSGSLTIPAAVGWVTEELSPHLSIPANSRFGVAVDLPTGTISYGAGFQQLPASNKLIQATGAGFAYQATPLNPYTYLDTDFGLGTSYLIDVEVAVSEMMHIAPADMADGDVLQIGRTINGTVNTGGITTITDAYTVNLHVSGGPLDGTDVDVWVPDTTDGLLSADMELLRESPDPDLLSLWESSDGALWAYIGGGVYDCLIAGSTYPADSKTTRVDTPSLLSWSP